MKHFFTSLKFMLSALMLCLAIGAQAGDVVFNGTTDTNGKADASADQLTKNGVTLSVSNGYLASGDGQYRTYKGQTLTISSSVGAITKVVFTCTANDDTKYGPGCFTVATGNYSYEGKIGTWTGAANEVVFTAESNQVRATEIVVTVDGDTPVDPDPVDPDPDPEPSATYTSIAGMKAASTADKTDVKYQFKDLLVTYVNGVYSYVSDGTDGFLFYGASELVAGDKITGSVTGKLYQYNGLNEMAENSFTIDSKTSGNAVTPQTVAVEDILSDYLNYESEYVKISGVSFNGALANGVTVSQNGSDLTIYNRFNLSYDVNTDHKYDIYGFPAIFKGTVQLYVTEIVDQDGGGPGPGPEPTDAFTSIAAMKAAATADKTDATYQFKDLLVTYVSGAYNFVSDGTDGFLFYGTSEFVAGDKITGSVTGKLYQYNGLTEMSDNTFTIESKTSGNAVTPQDVAVATILSDYRNYENEYVKISDVTFNGALANGVTVSQNGSDLTIYNRFNLSYDVNTDHKFDIYGFPAIFKETIQLYVTEIVDKDGDTPGPGPEPTDAYTSIAAMKAAATADKTDASYKFKDLLVTYVSGAYNFVSDGTDGFLFYGASDLAAGDKITGFVTGKLYQYNGLTEMSDNTFTIESKTSGNAVTPQDVAVASILSDYRNYESEYVKISGVTFNGDFANGVTVSQNGSDLTLYNRFKYNYTVDTSHTYDIYGFPAIYGETIQLYVTEIVDKDGGGPGPQPETKTYTSIADAKAAATADRVTSVLKLDNVLVTYVNGSSTYLADDDNGFLLYGNVENVAAGEIVNIEVEGELFLYNGIPELSVKEVKAVTTVSSGNAVTPVALEVADVVADPFKYSNMLVSFEGVNFLEEAFNNRNVTITQDGEELVVRDNWRSMTDESIKFSLTDTYTVTGFVAMYNGAAQIYPRDINDIVSASAIRGVELDATTMNIYNLAGQKMENITRGGLYIVNGKKVLVK